MNLIFDAEIHHVTKESLSVNWYDGERKEEHLRLGEDGKLYNINNRNL